MIMLQSGYVQVNSAKNRFLKAISFLKARTGHQDGRVTERTFPLSSHLTILQVRHHLKVAGDSDQFVLQLMIFLKKEIYAGMHQLMYFRMAVTIPVFRIQACFLPN